MPVSGPLLREGVSWGCDWLQISGGGWAGIITYPPMPGAFEICLQLLTYVTLITG